MTSAAAVLAERVDRAAREVVVGEEPGDALAVVEAVVVQQRQQAGQPLDHQAVLDEVGRHPRAGARHGHRGGELVLADHRAHLARRHAEQLGDLAPVEPLGDEGGQVTVGEGDVSHGFSL